MSRSDVLTCAAWILGLASVAAAGFDLISGSPATAWLWFCGAIVLLGAGGLRPLGEFLWHGVAETAAIAAENEKGSPE